MGWISFLMKDMRLGRQILLLVHSGKKGLKLHLMPMVDTMKKRFLTRMLERTNLYSFKSGL